MRLNRRTALKGLGALAASPLLTTSCEGAVRPLRETIDTVVVLMMENRSFDHVFGSLSLEEGRTDVDGLRPGMFNPTMAGTPIASYAETLGCYTDPPHSWNASRTQFNEGKNDGFVRALEAKVGPEEAKRVMGYFRRADLPILYTLADHYALCQRWHASVLGPTWPNRFYLVGAQSNGVKSNDASGDYSFSTIFDRLEHAGLDFAMYYGNISLTWMLRTDYTGHYRDLDTFHQAAAAGKLPPFSLVEPLYGRNDDHPPAHPLAGELYIASIYDALARSPQWDRCLFVVCFDEHGGFFDHVAPPKTADDFAGEGFDQLGFRVPAVVMGPYVKQGVSSTLYDHSSILAFVERLYDLPHLTARDAAANDLMELLDADRLSTRQPAPPISLPTVVADESVIYGDGCVFTFGSGEGGLRPATGQPELEAYLDANPRPGLDRRASSDQSFAEWLAQVERRGLFRPRKT